ncbi:MAG: Stp1/IreP family PP2C-type Ser/Thr phosphatase [Acidobacteriota bacterium]|nr:Stp1/IreP family PP2C-type Ser/Thr phosphatase [Acidobacteriota bacterium]
MKRKANEDNFCTNQELGLFLVADGMGGHAAGEVASRIAVEEIERILLMTREDDDWTWPESFDKDVSLVANKLRYAITLANEKIRLTTMERVECRGMGTTVVAAMMLDDSCSIAHVGDSRAYLIRENKLLPITSDHSWVNEQLKQGFLTAENARNHPFRNVITQALGSGTEIQVDLMELPLKKDDLLLLCSDGLNSMLTDHEILSVIVEGERLPLDILTGNLIEAANFKGGDDNITVSLVRIL